MKAPTTTLLGPKRLWIIIVNIIIIIVVVVVVVAVVIITVVIPSFFWLPVLFFEVSTPLPTFLHQLVPQYPRISGPHITVPLYLVPSYCCGLG